MCDVYDLIYTHIYIYIIYDIYKNMIDIWYI